MNNDFLKIAGCAVKAPSGHNTQPWIFVITENSIVLKPDFNVALPVVDPDNRELYISLGCALENLLIAARHFGYEAWVNESSPGGISVGLAKNNEVAGSSLFSQIEKRQTNRAVYAGEKIPSRILERLKSVRRENQIQFYFAEIGSPLADTLAGYIGKGNTIQMSDQAFKEELLSWMRFNKKQVGECGDGLSYDVFGNPPLPRWMAKTIVHWFLKPDKQNKSDQAKIASSSHLVVFTTQDNTIEEWIDLGRTLQRFLLEATEAGIACAHLNQACEVPELSGQMRDLLPINREYPTLMLRMGYAEPMPFSLRKRIEVMLE